MILFVIYHSANSQAHCSRALIVPEEGPTSAHTVLELALGHGENATGLHGFGWSQKKPIHEHEYNTCCAVAQWNTEG